MTTVYQVLQELWAKAVNNPGQEYEQSKKAAIDDAAVKIYAILRGRPAELPEIPPGKSLSISKMPYFYSMPWPKGPNFKRWFVVGVAEDLPEGEAVVVNRYGDGDQSRELVVIRQHEYERVVRRGKENERRYVLASFDKEGW